eukprot:6395217-Amphidinium_carterae.1
MENQQSWVPGRSILENTPSSISKELQPASPRHTDILAQSFLASALDPRSQKTASSTAIMKKDGKQMKRNNQPKYRPNPSTTIWRPTIATSAPTIASGGRIRMDWAMKLLDARLLSIPFATPKPPTMAILKGVSQYHIKAPMLSPPA